VHPRKTLLAAACCAALSPSLCAEPDAGSDPVRALDALVVTATRTDEAAGDVAATVSVIDSEQVDRELARDIHDLVRYEPGVSVGNDVSRFGLSGFTIRGLGGNRVAIEVDGVPVSDAFAIGSFSSAMRDAVDVDMLKQVEIVRGPGSSLHGSDALAGVIGFVTKDPDDFVSADDAFYVRMKLGLHGIDDGEAASALVAAGGERWSTLALAGAKHGHERDNQGGNSNESSARTALNPQDYDDRSLLAKLLFHGAEGHRLQLTVDAQRSQTDTDVFSGRTTTASGPSVIRVLDLTAEDEFERDRLSLDYRYHGSTVLFDEARVLFFTQDSDTTQDTFEQRVTTAANGTQTAVERERRFTFAQGSDGIEATLRRDFAFGTSDHRLVYGFDWQRTDTTQLRNGLQRNLATGVESPTVSPDTFPVRDFPLSESTETGVFVQDRIRWMDGRFELLPGLRWDSIELDPTLDPIFAADNPGIVPVGVDYDEVSPRLGASWRLDPAWSLHAQWSEGFRAPPYSDVNVGFTNVQFGYTAIPNPELDPEYSEGLEVGVRARGDTGYAAFTLFRNEYDDFIESLVSLGVDPRSGLIVFQSQNIADVRIEGAEFRGSLDLSAWSGALEGWRVDTALSYAKGDDRSRDLPLDSVDPARAVIGVGYEASDGRWGGELIATAVRGKDRIDESIGPRFQPDGYVILDLLAHWRPFEALTFNAGVFNLLDKTYWNWPDVRSRAATDPVIDRYTSPGRNVGVNVIVEF
jgi:hemoglobin/transferrin/lactoferrin receptor protein